MVDPLDIGGRPVSLGASVGITIAEGATAEPERLIGQADAAMYRAKRDGKGRYQLFEASMHTLAVERLNLEQALRRAVTNGELTVHYQPVVDAPTGRVTSFEALARWCDPDRGFVEPGVFIPLAEETGLIHDIGRAVLVTACRQAQVWLADDPARPTGVAVNVSGRQLLEPGFVEMVSQALAGTGLDPRALTLEITESVFAADAPHVLEALQQLRRRGIGIAIDDFGTGYSSFARLADLPIDTIKIDKRFVDGLDDDRGRGIIAAIIGIARTLGLSTVAEGAEDPAQQLTLVDLGCTQIQGFLFARPMPAEETLPFLRQHPSSRAVAPPGRAAKTDAAA
jgi:predicted signal transduction protein with EAL and GGDEF domain